MHLWSFFLNFVRHCLNSGLWYSVSISAHTITQLLLQLFQVRIEHILCTGLKIISLSSSGEKRKPFIKCKETEWGILVGNIQQKVHFIFYIWPTIKLFQKGLNGYVCEKHHIYVRIKYIYILHSATVIITGFAITLVTDCFTLSDLAPSAGDLEGDNPRQSIILHSQSHQAALTELISAVDKSKGENEGKHLSEVRTLHKPV